MPTQPTDPWLSLGAGILAQAAIEAKKGDPQAIAWLKGDEAAHLAECLGVNPKIITRWADARRKKKQPASPDETKGLKDNA